MKDSLYLTPYFDSPIERDDFHTWAFGETPGETGLELMDYWNHHHGHLLTLLPDDNVADSLKKMIQAYRELHPRANSKNQ